MYTTGAIRESRSTPLARLGRPSLPRLCSKEVQVYPTPAVKETWSTLPARVGTRGLPCLHG